MIEKYFVYVLIHCQSILWDLIYRTDVNLQLVSDKEPFKVQLSIFTTTLDYSHCMWLSALLGSPYSIQNDIHNTTFML